VIGLLAPRAAAQAIEARSNLTAIGEENCPSGELFWRLKSIAAKRVSFPRFFVFQQVAFMPPVFPDVAQ
jgi:hypothetical protein